jgi:N-acetylglutamate synthase-like GNAT family acetyltransferase
MGEPLIRDAVIADTGELDLLLQAAYSTRRSFGTGLRSSIQSGSARTFVADIDGKLVGIASLHDYGMCGYVAQVGVDPAFRRRGIARKITEQLIAAADARGYGWLELDATPMGAPLYRQLGFADFGETIVYEGPTYGATAPEVELVGPDQAVAIGDFDWSAFGADRSATIGALFEDPTVRMFAVRDHGIIVGYACAREDRIAPWIAQKPEDAMKLLEATRAALAPMTAAAYVPSDNSHARAALELRGFSESVRCTHMVRGRRNPARRDWIYGRVSLGEG